MEIGRKKWKLFNYVLFGLLLFTTTLQEVQSEVEGEGPSESECQPYIEKALKKLETGEPTDAINPDDGDTITDNEDLPVVEVNEQEGDDNKDEVDVDGATTEPDSNDGDDDTETAADDKNESQNASAETEQEETAEAEDVQSVEENVEVETEEKTGSEEDNKNEDDKESIEKSDIESAENDGKESAEKTDKESVEDENKESVEKDDKESVENNEGSVEKSESAEETDDAADEQEKDDAAEAEAVESVEAQQDEIAPENTSVEKDKSEEEKQDDEAENPDNNDEGNEAEKESDNEQADEGDKQDVEEETVTEDNVDDENDNKAEAEEEEVTAENTAETEAGGEKAEEAESDKKEVESEKVEEAEEAESEKEENKEGDGEEKPDEESTDEGEGNAEEEGDEDKEEVPEEDLSVDIEIPDNLRPRDHIDQLLKLDESNLEGEAVINRVADITLKELKRLYENAIKPLEILYKYRDLSNRHFGDSEIFSKPLVLFMGPWSGGKSSIVNYLTDNEYTSTSLRTGAEPSPAYFNILMYGDEPEVLDGTQLAADFTFAGLQKFGQGLEERLKGLKLPNKLLEKVNIVEIPGILEVRKQVSRVFPFNDACQWFIDRADIIFLIYDPSKLDVGPETEAILDQLKGREHQTRIILNKADQVKPEELMRVQGALIWNISPLMSSAQPPVMYTTSLWSRPYESWAPVRLLQAQERAFLRDLRSAIDKRIEHKIASARRFAVRVRNHAKMVDCYLTTYYNHKSVFGNRKQVADKIIEHPQDYHIYEGLSTLTNISRYDLPDPDVYRDFFRLNPLYDFQQLSATCTYFRGCPINRLDVAIAYDLPELVGKHKKMVEAALAEIKTPES